GAARDAVPDRLLGHGARYQRGVFLGEHEIAKAHDHELGRQRLAGGPCRTSVLAAAALGAGVGVEHLLPGEVLGRAGAEAELLLGDVVVVEREWLEAAAGAGASVPNVDRGGGD